MTGNQQSAINYLRYALIYYSGYCNEEQRAEVIQAIRDSGDAENFEQFLIDAAPTLAPREQAIASFHRLLEAWDKLNEDEHKEVRNDVVRTTPYLEAVKSLANTLGPWAYEYVRYDVVKEDIYANQQLKPEATDSFD